MTTVAPAPTDPTVAKPIVAKNVFCNKAHWNEGHPGLVLAVNCCQACMFWVGSHQICWVQLGLVNCCSSLNISDSCQTWVVQKTRASGDCCWSRVVKPTVGKVPHVLHHYVCNCNAQGISCCMAIWRFCGACVQQQFLYVWLVRYLASRLPRHATAQFGA